MNDLVPIIGLAVSLAFLLMLFWTRSHSVREPYSRFDTRHEDLEIGGHIDRVEAKYGKRPRIAIGHGEELGQRHWRGELDDRKFVYCPQLFLVAWNNGDYDNKWCPGCKKFFVEGVA